MKAKDIENRAVKLSECQPHARNYQRHSEAQLADLRESLRQFGQVRSIVVQRQGKGYRLVAGHGIAQAAKLEGYTELRADVIPAAWSERKVLAYLAADNEIARHGDPDQAQLDAIVKELYDAEGEALARLAAGERSELARILSEAKQAEGEPVAPEELIDKAAELQKKWRVARGDIWQVGKHRLMCGDSTSKEDVESLMQGEKAQLVFTDPPYGVDYDGGTKVREKLSGDSTTDLYNPACEMAFEFSDDKSALYLWHAGIKGIAAAAAAAAAGYEIRCEIVWNKNQAQFGALSAQYKQKHEPCYYCYKRGKTVRWYGPKNEVTVWDCDRASVNEFHPTQKPPELAVRALCNSSMADDIVLDLFLGSGTTLVACEQTGRIGYGMEISDKYVAVSLERLCNLGLEPQRVNDERKKKRKTGK